MGEFNDGLPEKRPAIDFTDQKTMERIRSTFLGVDPEDAWPGIRKGPNGRPIITVRREVFENLRAKRPIEGMDIKYFEDDSPNT